MFVEAILNRLFFCFFLLIKNNTKTNNLRIERSNLFVYCCFFSEWHHKLRKILYVLKNDAHLYMLVVRNGILLISNKFPNSRFLFCFVISLDLDFCILSSKNYLRNVNFLNSIKRQKIIMRISFDSRLSMLQSVSSCIDHWSSLKLRQKIILYFKIVQFVWNCCTRLTTNFCSYTWTFPLNRRSHISISHFLSWFESFYEVGFRAI